MLNNLSINTKLLATVVGSIVIVSLIILIESINSLKNEAQMIISQTSNTAYKAKEQELENYVSLAYETLESYYKRTSEDKIQKEVESYLKEQTNYLFSILNSEYEKNKDILPKQELQSRLKSIINSTKFGKSGYFFGYNEKGTCIIHGSKESLIGKNLINVKDKNGKFIIKELIKIGTSQETNGFMSYLWPKPNSDETNLKISYIKTFEPYGWILGTGAYLEDVSEQMKEEALNAITNMKYGENGYFWVNDSNHVVKAHGAKSSLVNQNMYNLQDKKGNYLYRDIVKTANSKQEGGLVKYYWTIPGKEGTFEKYSYVKRFEPWDFIVGTGAYITDIEQTVKNINKSTNENINNTIMKTIITVLIVIIIISILSTLLMKKIILQPLKNFQSGLLNFFKYINKEQDDISELKQDANDEIGHMISLINDNINKTKQIIEQDNLLINDVKQIVNHVGQGFIDKRIEATTNNQSLEELKELLNNMLLNVEKLVGNNINNLTAVLEQYSNRDFTKQLDNKTSGQIGLDITNMNKMITTILVDNKKDGVNLQEKSQNLTNNVRILNENATSQAASLEQTAASIEEITANIRQTSEKAQEMSNISAQTQKSADVGKDLASKTVNSMEDINETVININEAISVIDQIAFQTNILSLNAAVEAATAGEAGKGFAVVAAEVRNLASRSAEAAKEIKELVESATVKANEGKEISGSMIQGFQTLEKNITNTNKLIDDVTNAAKEQTLGISQISDAVNQLDQFTQQNANIADKTNYIAIETNQIANEIVENVNNNKFNEN